MENEKNLIERVYDVMVVGGYRKADDWFQLENIQKAIKTNDEHFMKHEIRFSLTPVIGSYDKVHTVPDRYVLADSVISATEYVRLFKEYTLPLLLHIDHVTSVNA